MYRAKVWGALIGNTLRINKQLFYALLLRATRTLSSDSIIKKDIDRTFFYFVKNDHFGRVLQESTILLQMFTVS